MEGRRDYKGRPGREERRRGAGERVGHRRPARKIEHSHLVGVFTRLCGVSITYVSGYLVEITDSTHPESGHYAPVRTQRPPAGSRRERQDGPLLAPYALQTQTRRHKRRDVMYEVRLPARHTPALSPRSLRYSQRLGSLSSTYRPSPGSLDAVSPS